MNKKALVLFVSFLPAIAKQAVVEDYTSGQNSIANIMSGPETALLTDNKAESLNLEKDLNTDAIAATFPCQTIVGQAFLKESLKSPIKPDQVDVVLKRQNAIKTLVENPELKKEVDALLAQAKIEEQEVIKLFSDCFKNSKCPELIGLEVIKKQNPGLYPIFKFLNTTSLGKYYSNISQILFVGLFSLGLKHADSVAKHTGYSKSFIYGYAGFMVGFNSYVTVKDYLSNYDKRQKIHSLNQMVQIADRFEELCKSYSIQNVFNISQVDKEAAELEKELRSGRYKNKNTIFFQTPLVHSFLYKLYEKQMKLASVFACIAELDAYNAIATKILESKNNNNKFCFVNFIDNKDPKIVSKGFWNVLVEKPVVNDIAEDKHVILTGPNAGGKTTSIRSILQNIVLGQTYGVAAAEKFNFTMFDVIHSYLNVSDDLIAGLSLFKSEVKRAQDVLQRIKSLEEGKKYFFALDELFTGTAAEDGETCAYEFIKRISEFKGVQFIYATHFDKLKQLGKDNDKCENYKVNAPTKDANDKLVYPFTLSQGANEARVALDIAKEANLFA